MQVLTGEERVQSRGELFVDELDVLAEPAHALVVISKKL